MAQRYLFWLATLALLTSCVRDKDKMLPGKVMGYRPVYSNEVELYTITNTPPRGVARAGKIYVKGNYIFQNEVGEGIHIIDNSTPATAQRVGFIRIKGSEEISIKGNYLYSNNFSDLVVVDISDIAHVTEVKRIKDAFNNYSLQMVPPTNNSYFECVDNSKGVIVSWVRDSIINPKCRN